MANPVGRPKKNRDEIKPKNPVGRPKINNEIWVLLSTRISLEVEEQLASYLVENPQIKKAHLVDQAINDYLELHEKSKVKKVQEKDEVIQVIMPLSCRIKADTDKRLKPYLYKAEAVKSHVVDQAISDYISSRKK